MVDSPDRPMEISGGEQAATTPEVLSSKRVYTGKIINLRVDEVVLAEGRRTAREVVEHPGAVVMIPLYNDGEVILVEQYRHAAGRPLLELPAGTLEPGEEPLVTARRELREEVGLEATRWTRLGHFYSSPGFSNEILHVFLAEGLRPGYADADEDEDIRVVRCKMDDLYERPELLQDAKSLAALFLLNTAKGRGSTERYIEGEHAHRSTD